MQNALSLLIASILLCSAAYAQEQPIIAKKVGAYFQLELHRPDGKHSYFVMDTGSTGIVGSAKFFTPTKEEKSGGTCVPFGYSSSGNRYAGYIVKRDLSFGTIGEQPTKHLKDFPVYAAVQRCPAGKTPNCSSTPPEGCTLNPQVYMMGVGFDQASSFSQKDDDSNAINNPFLNLVDTNGKPLPQQNYALSSIKASSPALDVYLASPQNPLPNLGQTITVPLSKPADGAETLITPQLAFALRDKTTGKPVFPTDAPQPVRFLPDTGISYGILSVSNRSAPCCTEGTSKSKIDTSAYDFQLFATPESKTPLTNLSYGTDQPLGQSARWSLNHPAGSTLFFNSGQLFFQSCNYFYDPASSEITFSCHAADQ
ncbi:hypothetical protein ACMG4P_12585 [Pseudovibrio denitrificans]|uniref:hypothetical protein n=1 Tax=Pseudovibrio denitrificans TaxID=258256 RepID=UPI0039BF1F3E